METLADLAGLTLRVQESDMMSEMILDLGAKPAQVVYSRVYAALHNAEIDGAENNWPSYEAMGHYEVAPYFLKDEHTRVPELQLASEAAMEKLAELDERFPDIIRICGKESALTERRLWAEREASAEKHMREWGVDRSYSRPCPPSPTASCSPSASRKKPCITQPFPSEWTSSSWL